METKKPRPKPKAYTTIHEGHMIFNIPIKDGVFRFGIGKACKIMQYLEEIRDFVDKYGKSNDPQNPHNR